MAQRFRPVCFTLNNPTVEDFERIDGLRSGGYVKYFVYQRERGANDTPHIQGYVVGKDSRDLAGWKRLLGDRAHIERANGTAAQNRAYCTKEDTREPGTEPVEWGTCPQQGQRTDLDAVYSLIASGANEREILEKDPSSYIKYSGGIKRALVLHLPRRAWKTTVFWWYGSTGTGKSREAAERFPEAYWKPGASKWWDGYDGQSDVIVDDYRRDLCTFAELLRLLDRYPMLVEYKGGTTQFVARNIIITTPRSPRVTWQGRTEEDIAQLERRIEEVRCFGEEPIEPTFVATFNHPYRPLDN